MANEPSDGGKEQLRASEASRKMILQNAKASQDAMKLTQIALRAMEKGIVDSDAKLLRFLERLRKIDFSNTRVSELQAVLEISGESAQDIYNEMDRMKNVGDELLKIQLEQNKLFEELYDDYEKYKELLDDIDELGDDDLDRRKKIQKVLEKDLDIASLLQKKMSSISNEQRSSLRNLSGQVVHMGSLGNSAEEFNQIVASIGGKTLTDDLLNVSEFNKSVKQLGESITDAFSGGDFLEDGINFEAMVLRAENDLADIQDVVSSNKKKIDDQLRSLISDTDLRAQLTIDGSQLTDGEIQRYITLLSDSLMGSEDAAQKLQQEFGNLEDASDSASGGILEQMNMLILSRSELMRYNSALAEQGEKLSLFSKIKDAVREVTDEMRFMVNRFLPNWASRLFDVDGAFKKIGKSATSALASAMTHYNQLDASGNRIATTSSTINHFFGKFKSGLSSALKVEQLMLFQFLAIAAVVGGLIALTFGLERNAKKYSEELGVSRERGKQIYDQVLATTNATGNRLATEQDVLEVLKAHQEEYGTILDLNSKAAQESAQFAVALGKQYGITTGEAYKLSSTFKMLGADSSMADNLSLYVAEASNLAGVSFKEVTKDLAESSEMVALHFKGMPKEAAKAAIEIKRMGMSMKQVGAAMDKALDIGNFMNDMTELNLMTGGSANLQEFFDMRFSGASPDEMAKEIAEQYDNMVASGQANEFTMRKFAEATGTSIEELEKGRMIREDLAGLTEEQRATLEKHLGSLSKEELSNKKTAMMAAERLATQDKMNVAMDKLKNIFMKALLPIAESFGELLEALMPILDIIGVAFKFIGLIIKGLIAPIFKGILMPFVFLGEALKFVVDLFTGVTDKISEASEKSIVLKTIFGAIKIALTAIGFIIGGSLILGNLGKVRDMFGVLGKGLKLIGKGLITSFSKSFSVVKGLVSNSSEIIRGTFKNIKLPPLQGGKLFSGITSNAGGVVSKISNTFKNIKLPKLQGRKLFSNVSGALGGTASKITNVFKNIKLPPLQGRKLFSNISNTLGGTVSKITNVFKNIKLPPLQSGKVFSNVSNTLGGTTSKITNVFKNIKLPPLQGGKFAKSSTKLFGGLGEKLSNVFGGKFGKSTTKLFSKIGGKLSNVFGQSTTKLFGGLGEKLSNVFGGDISEETIPETPQNAAESLQETTDISDAAPKESGESIKEFLTNVAAGLKEMADVKVLYGALNLIPSSIGFIAMIPGSLGAKLLGYVDGEAVKESLVGIATGLKEMADTKIAIGSAMLPIAAIGFIAMIPGVIGAKLIERLNGESISESLAGLSDGLSKLAKTRVVVGSLMLPLISLGFIAMIPAAVGMYVVGAAAPSASVGLNMLAPALMSLGNANSLLGAAVLVALSIGFIAMIPASAGMFLLSVAGPAAAAGIYALIPSLTALGTMVMSGVGLIGLIALAAILVSFSATLASVAEVFKGIAVVITSITEAFSLIGSLDSTSITTFATVLISLAAAAAVMGIMSPLIIAGSVALQILGFSLIPAATAFSLIGSIDPESIIAFGNSLISLAIGVSAIGFSSLLIIAGAAALQILGWSLISMAVAFSLIGSIDPESIIAFGNSLISLAIGAAALGLSSLLIIAGSAALLTLGAALIVFSAMVYFSSSAISLVNDFVDTLMNMDAGKLSSSAKGIIAVGDALDTFSVPSSGNIIDNIFGTDAISQLQELADMADPLNKLADALERIAALSGMSGEGIKISDSTTGAQLEEAREIRELQAQTAQESIAKSSMQTAEVSATAAAPQSAIRVSGGTGTGGGGITDMSGIMSALEAVANRPIVVQIGDVELKKINRKFRALNNGVS